MVPPLVPIVTVPIFELTTALPLVAVMAVLHSLGIVILPAPEFLTVSVLLVIVDSLSVIEPLPSFNTPVPLTFIIQLFIFKFPASTLYIPAPLLILQLVISLSEVEFLSPIVIAYI